MATTLDQIATTLREVFPVTEGVYSLEIVDAERPLNESGVVTLRFFVFEKGDGGTLTIRDVKEQEVSLLDPALLAGDVPVLEALRGWAEAVREVFRRPMMPNVDWLMPHDLAPGDAFLLRRPTTAAEYRDAMLAKSRLGQWLAKPAG